MAKDQLDYVHIYIIIIVRRRRRRRLCQPKLHNKATLCDTSYGPKAGVLIFSLSQHYGVD